MQHEAKNRHLLWSRMMSPFFVCGIFFLIADTHCAILSYNNKFSNLNVGSEFSLQNEEHMEHGLHRTPLQAEDIEIRSYAFEKANLRWSDQYLARSERNKRSTDNTPQNHDSAVSPTNPAVLVKDFKFEGTEDANRAFIHWIGQNISMKIFILTFKASYAGGRRLISNSEVWRSDDYGSTFTSQKSKFDTGSEISLFYTFPKNKTKLLFVDSNAKKVYVTADELETVNNYTVPIDPDRILPHPADDDKLLLYSVRERKLMVSFDFAKTWQLVSEGVSPNFFWGEEDFDKDSNLVHMEMEGTVPTQSLYKSCVVPGCSDVNTGVGDVGPFVPYSLLIYKEYMFVQRVNFNGTESYLSVSYKRQPFKRAYFPGDLKANDFMMLSLDDGQVFVAVNHGDKVNLYLSDVTGQFYVLSMEDVYHIASQGWFDIDFHEVKGMNWTFIVNKREEQTGDTVVPAKTYISFDKGGKWGPLQLTNELKALCKNPKECSLLLHVKQSFGQSSMLSQENAPGLIVAHGNVGADFSSSEISLFTSRDGGWTWKKAPVSGSHHLNILDQGGVLTALPDGFFSNKSSEIIHYSCDEGVSWKNQTLTRKGLITKGVLTEPGSLSVVELVFGNSFHDRGWGVLKLNFSDVLGSMCEDSDYEQWFPRDFNSKNSTSNCILGRVVEYKRKDVGRPACRNGQVPRPKFNSNFTCSCTAEDFECDFGFQESTTCVKSSWYNEGYIAFYCDADGTYMKSQGYRKVPSDQCQESQEQRGKSKYDPVKTTCPVVKPQGLTIFAQARNVEAGQDLTFHLEQKQGSLNGTTYTWDFNDGTKKEMTGFAASSKVIHSFSKAGHYRVTVTAKNGQGSATASVDMHAQDKLRGIMLNAPWAGKVGLPVRLHVALNSAYQRADQSSDHVHYVWKFGDEASGVLPTLDWQRNINHTYTSPGLYTVSVEAVNSFSSLYKQISIRIFEDATVLVLTFSPVGFLSNDDFFVQFLAQRLRQQLAEDLGVSLDRIETVPAEIFKAHLYIFPQTSQSEPTAKQLSDKVKSLAKAGKLGVSLFGKRTDSSDVIKVQSAADFDTSDSGGSKTGGSSSGPNMTPVYIGVPILVLAMIVSAMAVFYCRKRARNARQYNILHSQDDSDTLLDDDDEAPLDLNMDFDVRESSRDDVMLDSGGRHLVMVTGGGADNAESC